jgi:hypothetical protein
MLGLLTLLFQLTQELLVLLVNLMPLLNILDQSKLPSNSMDGVMVIVSMVDKLQVLFHSHVSKLVL